MSSRDLAKAHTHSALLVQVTIRAQNPDGSMGDPLDLTGVTFEAVFGKPGGSLLDETVVGGIVSTTAEQLQLGTVLVQFPPGARKGVNRAELRMMRGEPPVIQTVWMEDFEVLQSVTLT